MTDRKQNGSVSSSQHELFATGTLMSEASPMFGPMMSEDTPNVIGSPGLESGVTPCGSPDGKTPAKSGPAHVLVNHSQRPAKAKRSTTKGIFGQSGFHSSKHDDLSYALVSRLRPLTDSLGSTLFTLTWTVRITPSGLRIPALRASAPRTAATVSIGPLIGSLLAMRPHADVGTGNHGTGPTECDLASVASPNTPSGGPNTKSTETHTGGMDLDGAAILAGWPTARAEDAESSGMRHSRGVADTMTAVASLASWATPKPPDLSKQAVLAGWKTPCVPNGGRGPHLDGITKDQIGLENEAKLSGWPTPDTGLNLNDSAWEKRRAEVRTRKINGNGSGLTAAMAATLASWPAGPSTDSGAEPIGYLLGPNGWEIVPASGQLNAAHSRFLMSLPPEWDMAAIAAHRKLKSKKKVK